MTRDWEKNPLKTIDCNRKSMRMPSTRRITIIVMLCLQASENWTQMGLNNDWMYYPLQNNKSRGAGTSDRGHQNASCSSVSSLSLSSGWQKTAAEVPLVSSNHWNIQRKNRKTITHLPSSLLVFHWAGLGHMPSPIPITGKGNKITTVNETSHDLFPAGNGVIFPWFMCGKGQFHNKIGVLLGRKRKEQKGCWVVFTTGDW